MASLIIENGVHAGDILELQRGTNVIGRAEGCDFVLEDPAISGRHCEIVADDFSIKVRDLGSSNGTFVEGVQVQEQELKDGQRLALGSVVLRLSVPPVHIAVPALPPPEEVGPAFLADGSPACLNHRELAAAWRCAQCEHTFCDDCVRWLRLVGRPGRVLCPRCSGACVALGEAARAQRRSRRRALLDTIRVAFTWKTPGK